MSSNAKLNVAYSFKVIFILKNTKDMAKIIFTGTKCIFTEKIRQYLQCLIICIQYMVVYILKGRKFEENKQRINYLKRVLFLLYYRYAPRPCKAENYQQKVYRQDEQPFRY